MGGLAHAQRDRRPQPLRTLAEDAAADPGALVCCSGGRPISAPVWRLVTLESFRQPSTTELVRFGPLAPPGGAREVGSVVAGDAASLVPAAVARVAAGRTTRAAWANDVGGRTSEVGHDPERVFV